MSYPATQGGGGVNDLYYQSDDWRGRGLDQALQRLVERDQRREQEEEQRAGWRALIISNHFMFFDKCYNIFLDMLRLFELVLALKKVWSVNHFIVNKSSAHLFAEIESLLIDQSHVSTAYLAALLRLLSEAESAGLVSPGDVEVVEEEEDEEDDQGPPGDFQGPAPPDYDETGRGMNMGRPPAAWWGLLEPQLAQALLDR